MSVSNVCQTEPNDMDIITKYDIRPVKETTIHEEKAFILPIVHEIVYIPYIWKENDFIWWWQKYRKMQKVKLLVSSEVTKVDWFSEVSANSETVCFWTYSTKRPFDI